MLEYPRGSVGAVRHGIAVAAKAERKLLDLRMLTGCTEREAQERIEKRIRGGALSWCEAADYLIERARFGMCSAG